MESEVIYKGVTIINNRTASTDSMKIMSRDIQIRFVADKWSEKNEDSRFAANSIARAKAIIDWLLENGSSVQDGRIITTLGDFDSCLFGCSVRGIDSYTKFMKGAK
jgi:hypothetical protein